MALMFHREVVGRETRTRTSGSVQPCGRNKGVALSNRKHAAGEQSLKHEHQRRRQWAVFRAFAPNLDRRCRWPLDREAPSAAVRSVPGTDTRPVSPKGNSGRVSAGIPT
jgi:hypothetical protein